MRLEKAGFETWAVGGAIRDVLLGLPSGDWDLTTRARPKQIRRVFRRTVPIGIEHGTVGVLSEDGTMFEVTTFRRDVETDGRHAVVAFADHIEEDLARRDFTINAIAWHPLREELLDPYGGLADLQAGVLRAVGDPSRRFAEDHLRVLRAIRFASRFGLEVEPGTWDALCGAVSRLGDLSAERIRDELLKVLDSDPRPSVAMGLYRSSGALGLLYPELETLAVADGPRWSRTIGTLDRLPTGRPLLRLAVLLRPLSRPGIAQVLVRLRLSNAQVDRTARDAAAPPLPAPDRPPSEFRRWLSRVGPERLSALGRMELAAARAAVEEEGVDPWCVVASWRTARAVRAEGAPLSVSDLALDGRDLIRLGFRPGPEFGGILQDLLDWVLEDPARNVAEILEERVLRERRSTGEGSG